MEVVSFSQTLILALISFIVFSIILGIFKLLSKDFAKSSLITTIYIFLFFYYKGFLSLITLYIDAPFLKTIFPYLWGSLFLISTFIIFRSKKMNRNIVFFFNIGVLVLMILTFSNIFSFHFFFKPTSQTIKEVEFKLNTNKDINKPDLYYIILDGYARNDILKDIYNYDNQVFTSFLKEKGFFVANKSHSNYSQTYLSLGSSLNLKYLDELKEKFSEIETAEPLIWLIAQNKVFKTFKALNYEIVSFSTGHCGTELKNVDHYVTKDLIDREFLNALLNSTFLGTFRDSFFDITKKQIKRHKDALNEVFDNLSEIVNPKAPPTLVFAHIICPHPPFVFDAKGNDVPYDGIFGLWDGSHWGNNSEKYKTRYLEQLKYVSSKIKTAITKLKAKTDRKKIIIIQSDHGPGSELDWDNPGKTNLKERMSILNAIYFDDQNYSSLYPEITPVNTFRTIFNKYFATKLRLLPDKVYFSKILTRYQFIDVTEKVKN
jgi:hypothetical protein